MMQGGEGDERAAADAAPRKRTEDGWMMTDWPPAMVLHKCTHRNGNHISSKTAVHIHSCTASRVHIGTLPLQMHSRERRQIVLQKP